MPEAKKKSKNIYQQLAKIQRDLKAPKGQYNKFGKFPYRSCEDILEALKPLLGDLHLTLSDDLVLVGDRFYVKSTVKISDGETSIENTAFAREADAKKGMGVAQITGTASSYARKYALNGLFAIDDTKDDDVSAGAPAKAAHAETTAPAQTQAEQPSNLVSVKQRSLIFALGKDLGHTSEKLKGMVKTGYKLDSFTDLTKAQASEVIDKMKQTIKENAPKDPVPAHEEFTGDVDEDVEPGTIPF